MSPFFLAQNWLEFPHSIWEIFTHEIDPFPSPVFFLGKWLAASIPLILLHLHLRILLCFVFLDHRKREERYRRRQTERSSSRQNSTAFPNILILIHNVHQFQHYFEFLTLILIQFCTKLNIVFFKKGLSNPASARRRWVVLYGMKSVWLPFPLSPLWSPIVTVQRIRRKEMEQQGNQVHSI